MCSQIARLQIENACKHCKHVSSQVQAQLLNLQCKTVLKAALTMRQTSFVITKFPLRDKRVCVCYPTNTALLVPASLQQCHRVTFTFACDLKD